MRRSPTVLAAAGLLLVLSVLSACGGSSTTSEDAAPGGSDVPATPGTTTAGYPPLDPDGPVTLVVRADASGDGAPEVEAEESPDGPTEGPVEEVAPDGPPTTVDPCTLLADEEVAPHVGGTLDGPPASSGQQADVERDCVWNGGGGVSGLSVTIDVAEDWNPEFWNGGPHESIAGLGEDSYAADHRPDWRVAWLRGGVQVVVVGAFAGADREETIALARLVDARLVTADPTLLTPGAPVPEPLELVQRDPAPADEPADPGADGDETGSSGGVAAGEPDDYGDDPALDALWDGCAAGDMADCDELYRVSPVGSRYEDFADTCGDRQLGGSWCDQ